jgi:hypothetical protein
MAMIMARKIERPRFRESDNIFILCVDPVERSTSFELRQQIPRRRLIDG